MLERARAAERCHRELPVHLRLEDGRLLEGVIDLAFLEQDRWVVVDFKSDAASTRATNASCSGIVYALSRLSGLPARVTCCASEIVFRTVNPA